MRKAHDTSGFPGCSSCHQFLDVGWAGKMDLGLIRFYVIRAMQRAFVHLIETQVVKVKLDEAKPQADRPVKPRKPPEQRAPIKSRGFEPGHRPMQSRNNLARKATS